MAYQPDWCIQNRIKQDVKYANAEAYTRNIQDIAKTSTWHERQQKFEVARSNILAGKQAENELKVANFELKERRKFRLKVLLEEEAKVFEQELARKGLAIYRDKL